jgi:hypothetical protein
MTIRLLRARGALARRFSRRDDVALVDPALALPLDAVAEDPTLAVADVVAVEPVEKVYRATVSRTVTQTAVVEFAALEGTDTNTLAQGLLETIPPEAWATQPADSWGYIDKIEEVATVDAAVEGEFIDGEDPLAPATMSRRRRALARRYAGKAAFDVFVDGALFGTYEAETPEDAVLAYVNEAGYATVDEAAAAAGLAIEDFLASVTAAEALVQLEDEVPADDEDEEEVPPATMARRRALGFSRRSVRRFGRKAAAWEVTAEVDRITAEVNNIVGFGSVPTGAATYDEAVANLAALQEYLAAASALSPSPDDPDAATAQQAVNDLVAWISELIPYAEEDVNLDWSTLSDEIPVDDEEEELPPATASRRSRFARRFARKTTGSEGIDWIDNTYDQADAAIAVGDVAALQALLDASYTLTVDPADVDAAAFATALTDLQGWLSAQIADVTAATEAITSVIDESAPATASRRGRRFAA